MVLYQIIRVGFQVIQWMIIARVIFSWVNVNPNNQAVRFIYEFTEPILGFFRRLMPRGAMPLDFSPLIALIVLQLAERFIIRMLF
ncbi:MAG: YggT family protein [Clostridia bacterium]|nr:YggT family protein [Clostridia bacterium]